MAKPRKKKGVSDDPLHVSKGGVFPLVVPDDRSAPVRVRVWIPRFGSDLMIGVLRKGSGGQPENSKNLGHRDTEKAKKQAWKLQGAVSAKVDDAEPERKPEEPLTVRQLHTLYLASAYHRKLKDRKKKEPRIERVAAFLGKDRPIRSIRKSEVEHYEYCRRNGLEGLAAVGQQSVKNDWDAFRSMVNWGLGETDHQGDPLIPDNLIFLKVEVAGESAPTAPIMYHDEFEFLRRAIRGKVPMHVRVFFRVIEAVGKRKQAVAALRWDDIDFEHRGVLWRGEEDKKGNEFHVALPYVAFRILRWWRRENPEAVYVFQGESETPFAESSVDKWMPMIYREAGLERPEGLGFHSFRRKFATERKDQPLRDVMAAGGWRNVSSVLRYQKADPESTRRVMEAPKRRLRRTKT